jgi:hypothetical protein
MCLRSLFLAAVFAGLAGLSAFGAIPIRSPEELRKGTDQIIGGKLIEVYQSEPKRVTDMEGTFFLAELKVTKVREGGSIQGRRTGPCPLRNSSVGR